MQVSNGFNFFFLFSFFISHFKYVTKHGSEKKENTISVKLKFVNRDKHK